MKSSTLVDVAIVDDDPNDRLVLTRALERSEHFRCVGCYADGQQALEAIPTIGAQAVLMDVRMPGLCGISCAQQLKGAFPTLTIIMITGRPELIAFRKALLAGADGFLDKCISGSECCEAIRYALEGGWPLAKEMIGELHLMSATQGGGLLASSLNEQETAVLDCIKRGLPNKQIAEELSLSIHMVKYEAQRIYEKLGAPNRAAAVNLWHSKIG